MNDAADSIHSNPYHSPNADTIRNVGADAATSSPTARYPISLAIGFVLFSIGTILPLIYGLAGRYFEVLGIQPPILTSWFVNIHPFVMVGISILLSFAILVAQRQLGEKRFRLFVLIIVGFSAAMTIIGVLAFLSPFAAILSGIGR